jgi:Rieske Fe-S protein
MTNVRIKLKNVRLSFPSLFKKATFEGVETKYEATFIIDKSDKKTIEAIKAEINNLIEEGKVRLPKDRICFKDGDLMDSEYNAGSYLLKASNKTRPTVLNRNTSPIVEEDDIIYGGCYVNAIVSFWYLSRPSNRRICCNLHGVQFSKDGERFGDAPVTADDFDDISDEEVDDAYDDVPF